MSQPYARTQSESDVPTAVTPASTYRLQLRPEFPFAAAEEAVPYLASLGVSHLHLSPVLEAVPGSAHGYDVTDHSRVRAELGGEPGLRALAAAARARGIGLVLDIVPNHMAVPSPLRLNRPLWEVLREGPHSPYARWFDIDWEAGGGQVLLPVLAGPLVAGDLAADGDVLRYGAQEFPLREGTAGLPLPELLAAQWYRPAWWREARTELNYRRFFTISDLIGLRVEDPVVFEATHAKVLELVRDGVAAGLRIDHVDGLADPEQYLRRLRSAVGEDCWVVVEKILARQERLPPGWPVAGTTGYDALHRVDGLFTDPAGAAELSARYREFTGQLGWRETASASAREVLTGDLAAELAALERLVGPELAGAVRELLIAYPVYRPYPGQPELEPQALEEAAAVAGADAVAGVGDRVLQDPALGARFSQTSAALRAKSLEDRAFYRYAPLLSATEVGGEPGDPAVPVADFHAYCAGLARDWPASGTVLSTHDTKRSADVRARIAVLSEVPELMGTPGGPDPQLAWVARQTALGLGEVPDRAPRLAAALLKSAREAGLRTSWTDPDEAYEAGIAELASAAAELLAKPPAGLPTEPATEAPAGLPTEPATEAPAGLPTEPATEAPAELPAEPLAKPMTEPAAAPAAAPPAELPASPPAEPATGPVTGPAAELPAELGPESPADPTPDFPPDLPPAPAAAARANLLGMALLHLAMPGVPELYQGTETEYRALVDPDNRRPARFPREALARLDAGAVPCGPAEEKLALTAALLRLRRDRPGLFTGYTPLAARGPAAEHCVAFARSAGLVAVATRLSHRLAGAGGWRDTTLALPPGRWTSLPAPGSSYEGEVSLADLLSARPVGLLLRSQH